MNIIKKTKFFKEQNPQEVTRCFIELGDACEDEIAYIDDTGVDTYLFREFGRSKRGIPVVSRVSGRKFRRVGVVATQIGKEIVSP